jgi:NTE family protein
MAQTSKSNVTALARIERFDTQRLPHTPTLTGYGLALLLALALLPTRSAALDTTPAATPGAVPDRPPTTQSGSPGRGTFAPASTRPVAEPAKRPKICLVLSGGGARGAAHVGVLKVLEQMRVPVDCITGTSMGSIVGAAYASGTSVAEMEVMLPTFNFEHLFKEKPPRQEQSIRLKLDDHTILGSSEFGVQDGALRLPMGMASGVQLESALRQLAKAKGYRNFDRLPIPYRAVATDLVTGKPVVFRSGELASVMRASMSVPVAIAPVVINGRILVDGGLTDNTPIAAARAMGADIIIVVNLGTPLMKREEIDSLLGVSGQMISILTEQNVRASLATLGPADILIEPELGDFSAADFDHMDKTIPIGMAAAQKVAARLARLAIPADDYAALRQKQSVVTKPDLRPVDEIRFTKLQWVNPAVELELMETRPGQPLDQAVLDRDMLRLYGTGDFEHVNYRIVEETDKRVLEVDAAENSWGADYARFGLGLSSDFQGDAYFNALVSYRKTWLNSLGAEWRNDFQIGHTSLISSEFYQPLDVKQAFFVAPRVEYARRVLDVFQGNQRLAIYDMRYARVAADLGSAFTHYGELRVGLLRGILDPRLDTGTAELPQTEERIQEGAFTLRLFFDQLDHASFARSGWDGAANVFGSRTALGADVDYTKWMLNADAAFSHGDHIFNLGLRFAGHIGSDPLPAYDQIQWGGFLQQSGLRTGALLGETLSFGRFVYYHKLAGTNLIKGLYGGFSLEAGEVGNPLVAGSPTGVISSGSIFLAVDTPLGPAYIAYGHASDSNNSLYFMLGRM